MKRLSPRRRALFFFVLLIAVPLMGAGCVQLTEEGRTSGLVVDAVQGDGIAWGTPAESLTGMQTVSRTPTTLTCRRPDSPTMMYGVPLKKVTYRFRQNLFSGIGIRVAGEAAETNLLNGLLARHGEPSATNETLNIRIWSLGELVILFRSYRSPKRVEVNYTYRGPKVPSAEPYGGED